LTLFRERLGMYTIQKLYKGVRMALENKFNPLDQDLLKTIIQYIEDSDSPIPEAIAKAPMKDLGRVFELESEYLVIMPPNLAMRMPKKTGSSLDSVRDQIISMVAMHINVVVPE
jgi:hypothetical protein